MYFPKKNKIVLILKFIITVTIYLIRTTRSTVTIVNSACTQGSVWTPNVVTVQNWCLTCYCATGALSICKANILRSQCDVVLGAGVVVGIGTPTLPPVPTSPVTPTPIPTSPVTTTTARPPNATLPVTVTVTTAPPIPTSPLAVTTTTVVTVPTLPVIIIPTTPPAGK